MLLRLSLRRRLFWIIFLLALTNLTGIFITLQYAGQTKQLFATLMDRELQALRAARELETALVMQKGFATYYFLTKDSAWLDRPERAPPKF